MIVAAYERISRDAEQKGLGINRQREDNDALADRKWPGAEVRHYSDNDISAARVRGRTKHRLEYQRMLEDIASGAVGAVVAWELDRLCRDPAEMEEFFLVCERARIAGVATTGDNVDFEGGEGLMLARIKAAVAAEEVRKIQKRVTRKHAELAQNGHWSGGQRAFGWATADRSAVDEDEALLVKEACQRVLSGETPNAIANDWNARGVVSAKGLPWRGSRLTRLLRNPMIAGLRAYRGEVVSEAQWPALIDRAMWERVVVMLDGRARQAHAAPRSYLLTGLLRCGREGCGALLVANPCHGRRSYFCAKDRGGCNRLRITADHVEAAVVAMVFKAADGPHLAARLAAHNAEPDDGESLADEMAEIEERQVLLADDYASGLIKRAEWLAARDRLEKRLDALRKRLTRRTATTALDGFLGSPAALEEAWPALTFERRAAIVSTVLEHVTVKPARPGASKFDVDRLEPKWRY